MAKAPSSFQQWDKPVRLILIPMVSASLLLSGCNSGPEEAAIESNVAVNQTVAEPEPAAPAETTATALPASFVGWWGMVPNDCDPARDDAKGLMEVTPSLLRFYESRGTVKAVTIASPGKVKADIGFEGEGQTWQSVMTLTLVDGGKALLREEADLPQPWRYERCPA
jgi:hypothetical protein